MIPSFCFVFFKWWVETNDQDADSSLFLKKKPEKSLLNIQFADQHWNVHMLFTQLELLVNFPSKFFSFT